jgi:ribosomal protein S18 acetylase RimI-like enzyme
MIIIRRIAEHDAALLRDVRLRALADTPMAFGSTYAREVAFDDQEWQNRAKRLSTSPDAATFFAFNHDKFCGIIGCFRNSDQPTEAAIVSMWVAPEARRRGVAAELMEAAQRWAVEQGVSRLLLSAVETNVPAIAFYQKCGFTFTGETQPYPNDASVVERYMAKPLRGV